MAYLTVGDLRNYLDIQESTTTQLWNVMHG